MKKMMFNDRFSLTEAVIEKRKTVTRRDIAVPRISYGGLEIINGVPTTWDCNGNEIAIQAPYKVGEIVAVAQSYFDALSACDWIIHSINKNTAGWKNKMFVKAELMPRKIRILDVRAEKLQAITDEDCLREGIEISKSKHIGSRDMYCLPGALNQAKKVGWCNCYHTAKEAFAILIDKISGKGTWERNPYCWVINFELIK